MPSAKEKKTNTENHEGTGLEQLLNFGDIVIPVMGPTGAGKSTFINLIVEEEGRREGKSHTVRSMEVGKGLRSCTKDIQMCEIQPLRLNTGDILHPKAHAVVLVDTPGFDDTYKDDTEILQKIADWLKQSYNHNVKVAGVIYLHDISQDRFTGSVRRNLEIFKHLCGQDAFPKVVIVTTKAEKLDQEVSQQYESQLKGEFWKDMIADGVVVEKSSRDYKSARATVDLILRKHTKDLVLQLQREVTEGNKLLPETAAGRQLRYTIQQVLASQSRILEIEMAMASSEQSSAELEKRVKELQEQMKILKTHLATLRKTPLLKRLLRRFKLF